MLRCGSGSVSDSDGVGDALRGGVADGGSSDRMSDSSHRVSDSDGVGDASRDGAPEGAGDPARAPS